MRKAFRRRVWGISLAVALFFGAAVLVAVFAFRLVSLSEKLVESNKQTLDKILWHEPTVSKCPAAGGKIYDISGVENDRSFDPSDYVRDRRTGYFLYNSSQPPGFWLNFSDVTFIRKFRKPALESVETGEQWKLYSEPAEVEGKNVEVMVAHLECAPSRLVQASGGPDIDEQLKKEAQKIAAQLKRGKEAVVSKVDGWQVVEAETGRVRTWSGDVPAFIPNNVRIPWIPLHVERSEVWLWRTLSRGDLEAVSVGRIGNLYEFGLLGLVAFSLGLVVTYPVAKRYGWTGVRKPMPLEEALRIGESEYVEFKQEIRERDQLLKDVTAFANAHGGTVFVGVKDNGGVIGVGVAPEQRDAFERGLRDAIRQRIKPAPTVDVDFSEKDGRVVARVFVRSSWHRHSFEGRYYKRRGSQSVYVEDDEDL